MNVIALLISIIVSINAFAEENSSQSISAENPAQKEQPLFTTSYFYMQQSFKEVPTEVPVQLGNTPVGIAKRLVVQTNNLSLKLNAFKKVNFEVVGQYYDNDIDIELASLHFSRNLNFKTAGMGDTLIGANYSPFDSANWKKTTFSLFLSAPTGDYQIRRSDGGLVSYPGQLGSGTYDLIPQVSYKNRLGRWGINSKIKAKLRTGRNDLDYRLGDEIRAYATGSYYITRWLASNLTLYYKNWGEVDGYENVDQINNAALAAARPARTRGGATTHPGAKGAVRPSSKGRPPHTYSHPVSAHRAAGGPPAGVQPSSAANQSIDPFAAEGSRWSASLGLTAAIYTGPAFGGFIELAAPIYADQAGALDGLSTDWYVQSSIMSSF